MISNPFFQEQSESVDSFPVLDSIAGQPCAHTRLPPSVNLERLRRPELMFSGRLRSFIWGALRHGFVTQLTLFPFSRYQTLKPQRQLFKRLEPGQWISVSEKSRLRI
jgi:hypothetical protein